MFLQNKTHKDKIGLNKKGEKRYYEEAFKSMVCCFEKQNYEDCVFCFVLCYVA